MGESSNPEKRKVCPSKYLAYSERLDHAGSKEDIAAIVESSDIYCPDGCPGMQTEPLIKIGKLELFKDAVGYCPLESQRQVTTGVDLQNIEKVL